MKRCPEAEADRDDRQAGSARPTFETLMARNDPVQVAERHPQRDRDGDRHADRRADSARCSRVLVSMKCGLLQMNWKASMIACISRPSLGPRREQSIDDHEQRVGPNASSTAHARRRMRLEPVWIALKIGWRARTPMNAATWRG